MWRRTPFWLRSSLIALVVVGATATTALTSTGGGYPARRHQLGSGAAWLASDAVGQLALLDGSSAEVAAQVQVAERGQRLAVTQVASTAYAVNQASGTIRRVDGASFTATPPVTPIADARDGLQAYASTGALYAADTTRGVVVSADPGTLANRGRIRAVVTEIKPDDVAIDGDGRLWLLDRARGHLAWVDGGTQRSRRGAATPGAGRLVVAGGVPVLVDTARGTASRLRTRTGAASSTTEISLRSTGQVQVSGSPSRARVYAVTATGVFVACALAARECSTAVPLGGSGAARIDAGAPVESGDRVFIPDYASGRVWIVDLSGSRVAAQPKVLDPGVRFQLTARDGMVFFNDPGSERAGVIRLDGGTQQVRKYDPSEPSRGVTTGGRSETSGTRVPAESRGSSTLGPIGSASPSAGSRPPAQRSPAPSVPPSTRSTPARPAPGQSPGGSSSTSALSARIVASKTTATIDEEATFRADVTGAADPATAHWSFGDGGSAVGATATHRWSAEGSYQVSVRVEDASGRQTSASVTIRITRKPVQTHPLTVQVTGGGVVNSQPAGIVCPTTCAMSVEASQAVTLTAQPGEYYVFEGWSGACSGTGACTVTMSAARTVTATFRDTAAEEDCVGHDPSKLAVVQSDSRYQLVDSGSHLMATFDTAQQAQNALSVAKGYTQHCFIGRPDADTEYWKGGAGVAGPVVDEDCVGYTPSALHIVRESGTQWLLTDDRSRMVVFASEAQAVRGLRVARQYTRQCFIGRPDPELRYWR